MYTENELNDLMLKVNRICFSDKFKNEFVSHFKYLPDGLTYHIIEKDGQLEFYLMIKKYGYEHTFNNGITEFTDAYDFDIGEANITQLQSDFVKQYFFNYEPIFYNEYMKTAVFKSLYAV